MAILGARQYPEQLVQVRSQQQITGKPNPQQPGRNRVTIEPGFQLRQGQEAPGRCRRRAGGQTAR